MVGAAAATPGTRFGSGSAEAAAGAAGALPEGVWKAPATPLAGPGREIESVLWLTREAAARAVLEGVAYGIGAPRPAAPRPETDPAAPAAAPGADAAAPAAARSFVPGPYAIAHFLIRDWIDGRGVFAGDHDGCEGGDSPGRSRL